MIYSHQVCIQKHDYFSRKTILKPMYRAYMQLCVVKYVFSTATYMLVLKAQYILRESFDPLIFFRIFIKVKCHE